MNDLLNIQLSIIIVNYRSSHLVIDCIDSILRFNPKFPLEIIVVDNNSNDNSRKIIKNRFPDVIWIQQEYNSGFARANNAGMRAANSNTFLLLNPDTIAIDDSIIRCYQKLNHSEYKAAGVQLLNEDRTTQISGHYFMKGGVNHLLPLPYWGSFLRWVAFRIKTKIPNVPKAKAVEQVDWISGAFLMVKKGPTDKAGLMDEDFFLYAEEVEWCSRLKKTGALCIFGDLNFIHLQGEAVNKDLNSTEKGYAGLFDRRALQVMLSNHVRVRKQYGVGWFLFLLLNYTWGVLIYFIGSFIHRLFTFRNPFAEWPKCFAFAKNVFNIWKLSPVIIRNKPYFYKVL